MAVHFQLEQTTEAVHQRGGDEGDVLVTHHQVDDILQRVGSQQSHQIKGQQEYPRRIAH